MINSKQLKIGLLGLEDPADIRSYSGTPFHLSEYLRRAGNEVRPLGPYPVRHKGLVRIQGKVLKLLTGKHVVWERHALISSQFPEIVEGYAERNRDLDVLLSTSAFYLAPTRVQTPLVFWGDTTAAGVMGKYPYYVNVSRRMQKRCHSVEQRALDACNLAIFSNHWAANTALEHYRLDSSKVHVITYGANLLDAPSREDVCTFIESRSAELFRILFVGFDWNRKGADKAIEIVGELRKRGLDARLFIVGCRPPADRSIPDYVSILGKIAKSTSQGAAQLAKLMSEAHVLLLPAKAECAAVVLAEANAFGVPVVSSNVGGNSSLVRDGVNGFLLDPDAAAADWASCIAHLLDIPRTYREFSLRAFSYFCSELSWEVAVTRLAALLRSTVVSKASNNISIHAAV